jgi:hypothetical protein
VGHSLLNRNSSATSGDCSTSERLPTRDSIRRANVARPTHDRRRCSGTPLAASRGEVPTMDPDRIDDQNDMPRKDRNENEEFVPGPLDEPSEAHDSNEPIEDLEEDDEEIQEDVD